MASNFDLFRLNCLLHDGKSHDFNSIIASIVAELLYENNNREISKNTCYKNITETLKISIDPDHFDKIVEGSKSFEIKPLMDDVVIKLTPNKFSQIKEQIEKNSIEHFIEVFVQEKGYEKALVSKIIALLYKAVYDNINSFSVKNIKSILPIDLETHFSTKEILIFNEFLDFKNTQKNNALYAVFSKAIEFAIITSGKGVKKFSSNVFKGKEYFLDANIIFRLLGIGGEERKESLCKLLSSCNYQGIKFYYTPATFHELKRKISQSILALNRAEGKGTISTLEDIVLDGQIQFNNGFTIHYVDCRIKGLARNPDQYENKLLLDFNLLQKNYNINLFTKELPYSSQKIEEIKNSLFQEKKKKRTATKYTKTAANVDAINILFVKFIRGNNNFNYSDVKSFYLTTDRTLHKILSRQDQNLLSETIIPSQLFMLHNSMHDNAYEVDYEAFTNFLKRRTSDLKYDGSEVLSFIDSIRQITQDNDLIKEVLKVHSDKRYESNLKGEFFDTSVKSFKELGRTILDTRLARAEGGHEMHENMKKNAFKELEHILKSTKKTVRGIDILITVLIIPIVGGISKMFVDNTYYIIMLIFLAEVLKFIFSSKTPFLKKLMGALFIKRVKKSAYYSLTGGNKDYLNQAEQLFSESKGEVWK